MMMIETALGTTPRDGVTGDGEAIIMFLTARDQKTSSVSQEPGPGAGRER